MSELDSRYRLLQRNFHPDTFVNQSAQQQQLAEQTSAELNQGYNILKNSLARSQHLLALHEQGLALAETTAETTDDPALLMLQMERNEQLDEAENDNDLQQLHDEVTSDIEDAESMLSEIFNQEIVSQEQWLGATTAVQKLQFFTRLLEKTDRKIR